MKVVKEKRSKNRIIRPFTWVVFGLDFVVLFMGLFYGDRIWFYVFTLITSMLFFSAVINIWVMIDFKYLHTISKTNAIKGDIIEMKIEIHNERPFLYPQVTIIYETPNSIAKGVETVKTVALLPFSSVVISEEFTCNLRGNYLLGIKKVIVTDMFGFFTFQITLNNRAYHHELHLNVAPRVLIIDSMPLPHMDEEAAIYSNLKSTETMSAISDLREYRYGDSLKKIHWNMTSKMHKVFIKNYEANTMPEAQMFIDTVPYPIDGLTRFQVEDGIIECATAIANYMTENNLNLSIVAYQDKREILEAQAHNNFDGFYSYFANMKFNGQYPIDSILNLELIDYRKHRVVILLVYEINNDLFNRVSIMQKQGIEIFLFLLSHIDHLNGDEFIIISKLLDIGVHSTTVFTDQRIDEVLRGANYEQS